MSFRDFVDSVFPYHWENGITEAYDRASDRIVEHGKKTPVYLGSLAIGALAYASECFRSLGAREGFPDSETTADCFRTGYELANGVWEFIFDK